MTNRELGFEIGKLALKERQISNEILKLIILGLERRAYLEHGYKSMFDWLVKGFKYSNAAAYRRIQSAKMAKSVPEVAAKLESGEVNLTTLSKAQSAIHIQEKASGRKVDAATKKKIVLKIEKKSAQEAEQVLFDLLPEARSSIHQERKVVIDENTTRHSMNFPNEMCEDLKRAKELLSHKMPNASDAEILAFALKTLLEKIQKPTSAAEAKRVKLVESGCTFKDPVSGHVCGARYQVQEDHIIPRARGGTNDPQNLRPLCRQHNLFMAERVFGRKHMEQFRRRSD
jgi:hypothetical protein